EVVAYFRRVFTVDRLLRPFFTYCTEFRETQHRTGALVSGSTALQLFDRATYRNADLDIYVEARYAVDVMKFVRDRERYLFQPTATQDRTPELVLEFPPADPGYNPYHGTGISDVLNFKRDNQRVQLIVATRSPLDVILNYHSTCVMNIVTHSTAYSLFPKLSFGDRISRTFTAYTTSHSDGPKWAAAQKKYSERGFSFASDIPGDPDSGIIQRWIGDEHTWSIPL
ncbi:hypothetical protein PENSPDRAFT_551788, partial [Peniophora sp. CONT]